ncbi:MAG: phage integrase SAM-like domain-containing protein [Pygmaiobacter massiliensis]|nr:phage integrase SAM-like domain-containing protein [Pygmaiobacter massiliensis]
MPIVRAPRGLDRDPLFADYLEQWVTVASHNVQELTTMSRRNMLCARIQPYFDSQKITLLGLRPVDIESFYEELYNDDLSGSTVLHYHQFMKQALKSAVRKDMLPSNPFNKIDQPKKNVFEDCYYTAEEVLQMLKIFETDPVRVPVTLAAYYGFRRSEVLGLMWSSVDFAGHTISVQHKVIERQKTEDQTILISDQLKTVASRRTLPLIPVVEEELLAHKAQIEENRRI